MDQVTQKPIPNGSKEPFDLPSGRRVIGHGEYKRLYEIRDRRMVRGVLSGHGPITQRSDRVTGLDPSEKTRLKTQIYIHGAAKQPRT